MREGEIREENGKGRWRGLNVREVREGKVGKVTRQMTKAKDRQDEGSNIPYLKWKLPEHVYKPWTVGGRGGRSR